MILYKPENILENKTHKIWDFETQTDHPIKGRKPDPVLINLTSKNLVVSVDHRMYIKGKKLNKCLDLARELKY